MYFKKAYIRHIIFRAMSLIGLVSLYLLYYTVIDAKSYMILSLLWLGSVFIYIFLDYEKGVWRDIIYSLNGYKPIKLCLTYDLNFVLFSVKFRVYTKIRGEQDEKNSIV
ncbi:hypothetical protein D3C81_07340 [compost metagenome]